LGRDRNYAFFDIRVFNPFMQSPKYFPQAVLQEKMSRRRKESMITCERSEHGSFSPLVFSTSGVGPTANMDYKRIASMIAQKHDRTNNKTLHWIRHKLSYSLLHSAIMCLRGARSSFHHPATFPGTMYLTCHKGQVPLQ